MKIHNNRLFLCYVLLQLHSLVDPVSAMGKWYAWSHLTQSCYWKILSWLCIYWSIYVGRDAFVSKDKIPRTPLSKPVYQKHGKNISFDSMLTVIRWPWALYHVNTPLYIPLSSFPGHSPCSLGMRILQLTVGWYTSCYSDVHEQHMNLLFTQLWRPDSPPWFKVQPRLSSQRFLNTSQRLSCWCNFNNTSLQTNHFQQMLPQLESSYQAPSLLPHPHVWPRGCLQFLHPLCPRPPLKNRQPFSHLLNQLLAGHCLRQLQRGHRMIYIYMVCLHQLLHHLHIQSIKKSCNRAQLVHHLLKKALITQTCIQQPPLLFLFLQVLL